MHREVLTKRADELFGSLSRFPGFYLAGGTGLALQIGHRISVDFDLFSGETIKRSLLKDVESVFSTAASIVPIINSADELTLLVDDVKTTFLAYPFPVLDPLVVYEGVSLLSVREIAATKAYTIGRRRALKDYVDLYFAIWGRHATVSEIIDLAQKKYSAAFNPRLFFAQIVSLDDIETDDIEFLRGAVTKEEMERFFTECAKDYGAEKMQP